MDVSQVDDLKQALLDELAKCRACRFCLDVCPTYQATTGVETLSSFGRVQTLRHLLTGVLELDDSLTYTLYSCLQCGRCQVVCQSKGQAIEITEVIKRGRSYLAPHYLPGGGHAG
jgi:glycolate oxidase iron-sulfur subunit